MLCQACISRESLKAAVKRTEACINNYGCATKGSLYSSINLVYNTHSINLPDERECFLRGHPRWPLCLCPAEKHTHARVTISTMHSELHAAVPSMLVCKHCSLQYDLYKCRCLYPLTIIGCHSLHCTLCSFTRPGVVQQREVA
jgi:hypothetical protein